RQQMLRISEKYDVADEQGNKIVFVERPAHLLRNLGAILAGIVAAAVGGGLLGGLADMAKGSAFEDVLVLVAALGAVTVFFVVAVGLSAKRHVTFYRDQTKRSEEHTSELQSRSDLVCRLLLEKKMPPLID